MGTLDTRMSTIIRMPEIRTHIIPLHQPPGTADIGLTTNKIGIIITAAGSPDQGAEIGALLGRNSTSEGKYLARFFVRIGNRHSVRIRFIVRR